MGKSNIVVLGLFACVLGASGQTLRVTNTIPASAQSGVGLSSNVMAWMNQSLRSTSVTANTAFLDGERCGRRSATISLTPTNRVVLDPDSDLKPGEWMTAHFTSGIQGTNGTNLTAFQWSWYNAASGAVGKQQFLFRQRDTGFGSLAGQPFDMADIDDDGDLDIFYYSLGETRFYKNSGAGIFSFYSAVDTRVTDTGDLDGDGDLDLIGGESTETNYYLNIYTNSGAGDFSEGWTCVITNIGLANICVADVNGDGSPDLWVDGETFSCIYTNHGNAQFSRGQTLTGTGNWYADMEDLVTDLNGDGSVDILRPYDGASAQIWTNNGKGYFFLSGSITNEAGPFTPGDFNNDGKVDVMDWRGSSFVIYTNNGQAGFGPYVSQSVPKNSKGCVGDMDGDGDLDIVAAGLGYTSAVYVLVNNGGSFSTVGSNSIPGNAMDANVGDIDGDGTLDVMVYTAETSPRMIFLRNLFPSWTVEDGSGQVMTNAEPPSVSRGTEFGSVPVGVSVTNTFTMRSTCTVDFEFTTALTRTNGAATIQFTNSVSSNAFESTGGFVQVQVTFKPAYEGDHWGRLRLTDASGQAFDIMLHGISPGFVVTSAVPRNGSCSGAAGTNLTVMFSDVVRTASLSSNKFFAWGNQSGVHKGSVSVNSLTNQAFLDPTADFRVGETVFGELLPAITNVSGQQMAPFHWSFRVAASNATAGLLADSGQRPGTNDARGAAFGDLNRDGWVDLFVANYGRPCEVWTNNRAGVLCDSGQRLGTNRNSACVSLGDANGDGYLDAFVGNWGQTNEVWINNGAGVFAVQGGALSGVTNLTRKIVPGDFDSDGDLDLFTLFDGQTNWIWLNSGGGWFGTVYPVGCHAGRDAAAGDLNGDGFLELLIVNHDADSEIWFNNNGYGSFSATTAVHAAGGQSCALGDVDNDGDIDIAIGDDSETTVYRNDGHGGFSETFPNTIPGSAPVLQLADLDGDRDLDLVRMRDDGGQSSVWLNNGAGTFTEVTYQPLGVWTAPKGMDFGDVDNDGDIDLAMAATNGCRLWLNHRPVMQVLGTNTQLIASGETPSTGKGTDFGTINWASITNEFVITNASPVGLAVLNVTTTGNWSTQFRLVDIPPVVSAWSTAAFRVVFEPYVMGTQTAVFSFVSAWTGTPFQLQVKGVYVPAFQVTNTIPGNASNSVGLAAALTATFNLPVNPATANTNTFRVYSGFRGNLAGTVTVGGAGTEATFTPASGFLPGETVFAQLTDGVKSGDGLYSLFPKVWSFNVAATKGTGIYVTRLVPQPTPDGSELPWGVELGDLDHDGDLDGIMSIQSTGDVLRIFLNDGSANFTNVGRRFLSGGGWESSMGLALGDLDRDGDLDIVLGHNDINCCVLWNDGHAQFTVDTNALPIQAKGRSPAIGDLDGDGDLDILTLVASSPVIVWFNDGTGHFTDSLQGPTVNADIARFADVDGDGDLDAVLGGNGSGSSSGCVLMNNGKGGFTFNRSLSGYQAEVGDMDADGDFDIVTVGECKLWSNNGHGVFTESSIPSTPGGAFGLALGDADADGDLDFMTGDDSSSPTGFMNNGHASFSGGPESPGLLPGFMVAMGDLDGNGSLDAFWEAGFEFTHHVMLNTFPVSLTASTGPHGTIVPTGTVAVAFGSNASFVVTAGQYYWVNSLLTNGAADAAAMHARIYTSRWNAVHADGTVSVAFAEAFAALGTPEWWLAQYGWTNNFDAAETNDTDADGFFAWEEQIAWTDPTNGNSFFRVSNFEFQVSGKILRWNAISGRVYAIDGNTNLPEGWFELATNLPPNGIWTDTVHGADGLIHYRLGVRKE